MQARKEGNRGGESDGGINDESIWNLRSLWRLLVSQLAV